MSEHSFIFHEKDVYSGFGEVHVVLRHCLPMKRAEHFFKQISMLSGQSRCTPLRSCSPEAQLQSAFPKLPRSQRFGHVQDAVGDQNYSFLGEVQEGGELRARAASRRDLQSTKSHCHVEDFHDRKYDGDR